MTLAALMLNWREIGETLLLVAAPVLGIGGALALIRVVDWLGDRFGWRRSQPCVWRRP